VSALLFFELLVVVTMILWTSIVHVPNKNN